MGVISREYPYLSPSNIRHHDVSGKGLFLFETACVLTAYGLVVCHFVRLFYCDALFAWGSLIAIALAWPAADLASGIVHWLADTWGSESMPVIGPRFLRPFRVHHVTPRSFVECGFMDTNGDTALIGIPFLLVVFAIPLGSSATDGLAVFMVAFCLFALPTNQIHQWAHMPNAPKVIRWLQRYGIILSPAHHHQHHSGIHDGYYCITTGWCNRVLEYVGFFRSVESIITRVTGLNPRSEENTSHAA